MFKAEGFQVFEAEVVPEKYEILGDDMQVLNLKLDNGELVVCEPGSMTYSSYNMKPNVDCGSPCSRCLSGNPCILSTYRAKGTEEYIGISPAMPAKIIPFDLSSVGYMRCKSGSYLAHIGNVKLTFSLDCCSLSCCFGGQGCIRQSLGGDGTSFLQAMGTIVKKTLQEGETIVVDTQSVVAWQDSVRLSVRPTGGCLTCCLGGEGMFNTTLTGPGDIYMQSYSREKFVKSIKSLIQQQQRKEALAKAGAKEVVKHVAGAPVSEEMMER